METEDNCKKPVRITGNPTEIPTGSLLDTSPKHATIPDLLSGTNLFTWSQQIRTGNR